ncbi:hypothetical protein [Pelagibacterium montanilacus]|uniref:hypothetical protein n=1 Tax=Pelagibacterium montanilacus TaxID=2185280 RepID=UPI000F8DCD12|nr:hypothetical protein [Pelagibacterium montanilacus]
MAQDNRDKREDRTQRIILVVLVIFALILIGATITSTLTEWHIQETDPLTESQTGAETAP